MADTRQTDAGPPTLAEVLKRIREEYQETLREKDRVNAKFAGRLSTLRKLHDELEKEESTARAG